MDFAEWPTNRLLNTAARLTENTETSQWRSLGITQAGLTTLRVLSRGPAMGRSELARKLRAKAETFGKLLERLEQSQLIVRVGSSNDPLKQRFRITAAGRTVLDRADALEEEQERTLGSDEQLRAELINRIKALGIATGQSQSPPNLRLVPPLQPVKDEPGKDDAAPSAASG